MDALHYLNNSNNSKSNPPPSKTLPHIGVLGLSPRPTCCRTKPQRKSEHQECATVYLPSKQLQASHLQA